MNSETKDKITAALELLSGVDNRLTEALALLSSPDDGEDWRKVRDALRPFANRFSGPKSGSVRFYPSELRSAAAALAIAEKHAAKEGGDSNRADIRIPEEAKQGTNNATPAPDALGERAPVTESCGCVFCDLALPIETSETNYSLDSGAWHKVNGDYVRCTAASPGLSAPLAGMDTTEADRKRWLADCQHQTAWISSHGTGQLLRDIDRLTAALAEAKAEAARARDQTALAVNALMPFAVFADRFGETAREDGWVLTRNPSGKGDLTMGDVRNARSVAYALRSRTEKGQTT